MAWAIATDAEREERLREWYPGLVTVRGLSLDLKRRKQSPASGENNCREGFMIGPATFSHDTTNPLTSLFSYI